MVRAGRFGPYVQLGEAGDAKNKPRTSSLFKTMLPETLTLEQALQLLQLPRVLGADPADGAEVSAQNGRYGPYVKKGEETRSLESEEQLFTVTLDEALALLAQPRPRRGAGGARGAAAGPLKELGPEPSSGAPIVVKDGRFGPYVTDGTVNASLRKADSVEEITLDRALELLAEKRAKGPSAPKKKRAPAKRAAKKA
jgi:DNA topoisomerase-1